MYHSGLQGLLLLVLFECLNVKNEIIKLFLGGFSSVNLEKTGEIKSKGDVQF